MRTALARSIAVALGLLSATGADLTGQMCDPTTSGVSVVATAGGVDHAARELEGWGFGLRAEWNGGGRFSAWGSYHHGFLPRGSLHTAGLGGTALLDLPMTPCLTVELLMTLGGSLNSGDHHRNATVPLGLIFVRPGRLTPFLGVEAILSATDSKLLGYQMQTHAMGIGGVGGVRVGVGRFFTELVVRVNTLRSSLGPQPLGHLRADVSIGFRPRAPSR